MPLQLYRRFFRRWLNGRIETGNHRRVVAVKQDNYSYLVGYRHAVYAARNLDTGTVVINYDWASDATNASGLHVGALRQEAEAVLDDDDLVITDGLTKADGTVYESFEVDAGDESASNVPDLSESLMGLITQEASASADPPGLGQLFG